MEPQNVSKTISKEYWMSELGWQEHGVDKKYLKQKIGRLSLYNLTYSPHFSFVQFLGRLFFIFLQQKLRRKKR